jgi:hypothetical protein
LLEQIIVYPRLSGTVEWEKVPSCVKEQAEMAFYNGYELEDAYQIYGVDPAHGALVVLRPDGYVGMVGHLADTDRLVAYLSGILVQSV